MWFVKGVIWCVSTRSVAEVVDVCTFSTSVRNIATSS